MARKKNTKKKSAKPAAITPIVTEIFLCLPSEYDLAKLAPVLTTLLQTGHVPALLISAPNTGSSSLADAAKLFTPIAQQNECAALIENDCDIALDTGADGVHISQGPDAHQTALARMKPDFIAGGQATGNRHDAMLMAENGADYIYFRDGDHPPADDDEEPETELDQAAWWAKTFEVPTVLEGTPEDALAMEVDFLAVSKLIWGAPEGPLAALENIYTALNKKPGGA